MWVDWSRTHYRNRTKTIGYLLSQTDIIILYLCFLDKMKSLARLILSVIKTNYYNWFVEGFINITFDFKIYNLYRFALINYSSVVFALLDFFVSALYFKVSCNFRCDISRLFFYYVTNCSKCLEHMAISFIVKFTGYIAHMLNTYFICALKFNASFI